ncbi:hypothetical protein EDB86DRAFT_2824350 [Lactarius hatsudake]|nr:hypothetical protein EDB86DRAFT_2824350 [Lactarius hatsudake]
MLPIRGGIAEKERKGWRKRDVGSRDEQRDMTVSRSGHIGTNTKSKRSSEPSHRVNQTGEKAMERKVRQFWLGFMFDSLGQNIHTKVFQWGGRMAGFVILAANVDAIPTPPPQSRVVIGVDGLWGAHKWTIYPQPHRPKFPYLAWIPLHLSGPSILSRVLNHSVDKSMWRVHPGNSNIHVINPDVKDKLTVEWTTLKAALQDPFSDMSSHPRLPIQCPMKAYTRGFEALSRQKQDFGACTQPMSLQPLLHTLYHWYYPPLMCNVMTELETAAQGYAEHLDSFNPMKEVKPGHRAKRAKVDMDTLLINNPELRHLTDAGAVPDWFPGIQDIWTHAMGHISHLNLALQKSPRCFVLPPVHLFWDGEPLNQRTYYYHYLLLFNEIRNWPKRDLPGLTTQEWRLILGNTYWKKQWLRRDGNNPLAFDPNMFWKYGGSLLFSNVYEEIRDIKHLQFLTTFEKRWQSQYLELNQILKMWDLSRGCSVDPKFFHKKVWRSWVQVVCNLVVDWDDFEQWDWGSFSKTQLMATALSALCDWFARSTTYTVIWI